MTLQNVYERFCGLSGLNSEELSDWEYLLSDACADIERRVLPEKNTAQNSSYLEAAAAALAFYNYCCVLSTRQTLRSFKAGEVSGEFGDCGVKEAYALFLRSLEPCAGLFAGDDFIFGRVSSLCSEE